ncbi:hypothetical protein SAMN05216469_102239 [Ruminococcus albus]|uniref:Uncharacterized protein n=1 Tax=Ruminococcus albus TaxID=1264 RepID=A0A1H7GTM9_RUMAL|nr:hypothetical protein SAMN05216469_102239 [Ruminococcus albus]
MSNIFQNIKDRVDFIALVRFADLILTASDLPSVRLTTNAPPVLKFMKIISNASAVGNTEIIPTKLIDTERTDKIMNTKINSIFTSAIKL